MLQTKSGKPLHKIGIGTWLIAGSFELNPAEKYKGAKPNTGNEAAEIAAIQYSITKGQNHIDCAELYGGFYTDEVVGNALKNIDRADLYIADKLWKTSVGKGQARPAVMQMLRKLQTDYLDLLYIHAPWDDAPWQDAISQIDELIDEGIVRGFAVSNFTAADLRKALSITRHPIVANQMNYNVLYKDEVDEQLLHLMAANNIELVAYQPIKRKEVLTNPTIQSIASAHQATAAQVALAWLIQKDALPIPKATQREHIDENLNALDLVLTPDEIHQLDNI